MYPNRSDFVYAAGSTLGKADQGAALWDGVVSYTNGRLLPAHYRLYADLDIEYPGLRWLSISGDGNLGFMIGPVQFMLEGFTPLFDIDDPEVYLQGYAKFSITNMRETEALAILRARHGDDRLIEAFDTLQGLRYYHSPGLFECVGLGKRTLSDSQIQFLHDLGFEGEDTKVGYASLTHPETESVPKFHLHFQGDAIRLSIDMERDYRTPEDLERVLTRARRAKELFETVRRTLQKS
jgi:hypothetical protein